MNPKSGRALVALAGTLGKITTAIIAQAYREGDSFACHLIDETGRYLVAGVIGIVNALNPSVLILGGGVIEGLSELVQVLDSEVRNRALTAAVEHQRIAKSTLGDNAGVIGAAALAREKVVENSNRSRSTVTA